MAGEKKITQLTATTSVDGADLATTVVNVSTTPANRKITIANFLKQIFLAAGTKLSFTTIADGEFLKRVGTNITSAAAAPADATYITQTANASLSNEQAMGLLATGMVKNTTSTGVLSIGVPATDYVAPGAVTSSGLTQTANRLLGRSTASTGAVEEISIGGGLSLAAGILTGTGGGSSVPSTSQGDLLYASATDVLTPLNKDTNATRYLSNTGSSNNPAWAQVALSTGISGFGSGVATALATNVGSAGAPVVLNGALGTPSSGTLSSCAGLPISTGVSGMGTGVATALAVNVGSAGAFVVFNGALGTPSSGTLSSCTGLPISTGVSGLGSNVASFLATPSSANLAAALTDETGSGAAVFGTSPVFTTDITLPNGTSPTTGSVAKMAFDTDAWGASRGAVQVHDGTANTYLVGVLASDTPSNGQVPTWNTGGTVTWETPSSGGSPGGSNTQVQFNDSSAFGGDADLTWNKTSNTLTLGNTGPAQAGIDVGAAVLIGGTGSGRGITMGRDDQVKWTNSTVNTGTVDVKIRRINSAYGLVVQNATDADRSTPTNQRWIYTQGGHRVTADFAKSSNTTLATITGCTVPLLTGSNETFNYYTFIFEAEVDCDATGGYKFAVAYSGTLDEGITYFIQALDEADGSIDTFSRQTSSGGSAGGAGPTAIHVRITGNISPGSNGNLTVQFAQNVANGTSTVKELGSLLTVTPILD